MFLSMYIKRENEKERERGGGYLLISKVFYESPMIYSCFIKSLKLFLLLLEQWMTCINQTQEFQCNKTVLKYNFYITLSWIICDIMFILLCDYFILLHYFNYYFTHFVCAIIFNSFPARITSHHVKELLGVSFSGKFLCVQII